MVRMPSNAKLNSETAQSGLYPPGVTIWNFVDSSMFAKKSSRGGLLPFLPVLDDTPFIYWLSFGDCIIVMRNKLHADQSWKWFSWTNELELVLANGGAKIACDIASSEAEHWKRVRVPAHLGLWARWLWARWVGTRTHFQCSASELAPTWLERGGQTTPRMANAAIGYEQPVKTSTKTNIFWQIVIIPRRAWEWMLWFRVGISRLSQSGTLGIAMRNPFPCVYNWYINNNKYIYIRTVYT